MNHSSHDTIIYIYINIYCICALPVTTWLTSSKWRSEPRQQLFASCMLQSSCTRRFNESALRSPVPETEGRGTVVPPPPDYTFCGVIKSGSKWFSWISGGTLPSCRNRWPAMWVHPPTSCLQNTYLHHLKTSFKAALTQKSNAAVCSIDLRSFFCWTFAFFWRENPSATSSPVNGRSWRFAQKALRKINPDSQWKPLTLMLTHFSSRGLPHRRRLSVGQWWHPSGFLAEWVHHETSSQGAITLQPVVQTTLQWFGLTLHCRFLIR